MGKRQKQEQTFPPQLGRTELCLLPQPGQEQHCSLQAVGHGTSQGVPREGRSRAGCGELGEQQGATSPKTWGKEQAARRNTDGLSSKRSLYSPTSPGGSREAGREGTSLLPWAAVDWGELTRTSVGLEQGIPVLEHSPAHSSCPQAGTAEQDMQGTHSCPQSPAGVQRSEQDLALTGTKPQQLLCPQTDTASPCQAHRDTAATK